MCVDTHSQASAVRPNCVLLGVMKYTCRLYRWMDRDMIRRHFREWHLHAIETAIDTRLARKGSGELLVIEWLVLTKTTHHVDLTIDSDSDE